MVEKIQWNQKIMEKESEKKISEIEGMMLRATCNADLEKKKKELVLFLDSV